MAAASTQTIASGIGLSRPGSGVRVTLGGVEYNMQELIDSYDAVKQASKLLGDQYTIYGTIGRLLQLARLDDADSKYLQDVRTLKDLGFDTDSMTTETFNELIACLGGGADVTK